MFQTAKIFVPLADLCLKMEGSYHFLPPSSIQIIGSFRTGTLIRKTGKTSVTIDLCIEMPTEYFTERDFLNYRYFAKRSLYAAHVCVHLLSLYSPKQIEFQSKLTILHKAMTIINIDNHLQVKLHFVPQKGTFKLHRFSPSQSNIRTEWFKSNGSFQIDENILKTQNQDNVTAPNPFYNYEILSDVTTIDNNDFLEEHLISTSSSISDAIKLIKVWLHKRQLNIDSLIVSMFISYLLAKNSINPMMSHNQIFRLFLLNLSESKWDVKGISLYDSSTKSTPMDEGDDSIEEEPVKLPSIDEFHKYYKVVFVDPSGYLNLTSKMKHSNYLRLKHEAANSVSLLNDDIIDSFDPLFVHEQTIQIKSDALVRIDINSDDYKSILQKEASINDLMDFYNQGHSIIERTIEDLLAKGLQNRYKLLFSQFDDQLKWPIHKKYNEFIPNEMSLLIGIVFNDNYDFQLIKGPSSEHTAQAKVFRQFWGPKSELRRFQDTSICEAVFFETTANLIGFKRHIYEDVIKYVLN
jgi:U3 small nucleolar RNA-associated protein 22